MKKEKLKKLLLSAMFIAIGLVLPFLTGQIEEIGNLLLPMHIPVMLCGLILGWQYGLVVGFITPLLRSLIFSMPAMYPNAVSMMFELATYGSVVGFLYLNGKWQCTKTLYRAMIISMIAGRAVWGVVQTVLLGFDGFTLKMFISGALLNAIPGILLQLVLIPIIMVALKKAKLVPLIKSKDKKINAK